MIWAGKVTVRRSCAPTNFKVWLPGLGAHWDLLVDTWTVFAGAHRGFVPPGAILTQ